MSNAPLLRASVVRVGDAGVGQVVVRSCEASMSNKIAWGGLMIVAGVLLVWFVLPVWTFHPCGITRESTIVDLPELNTREFATALSGVLRDSGEHYIRLGRRVYVRHELATDREMRSKYTIESVPEGKTEGFPVEFQQRFDGFDPSRHLTNDVIEMNPN